MVVIWQVAGKTETTNLHLLRNSAKIFLHLEFGVMGAMRQNPAVGVYPRAVPRLPPDRNSIQALSPTLPLSHSPTLNPWPPEFPKESTLRRPGFQFGLSGIQASGNNSYKV